MASGPNTACHLFLYGCKIRMVFSFLSGWKYQKKDDISRITHESYVKFKFQCPFVCYYLWCLHFMNPKILLSDPLLKKFATPELDHTGRREWAGRPAGVSCNNADVVDLDQSPAQVVLRSDFRYILMVETADLSNKSSRVCEGKESKVMPRTSVWHCC